MSKYKIELYLFWKQNVSCLFSLDIYCWVSHLMSPVWSQPVGSKPTFHQGKGQRQPGRDIPGGEWFLGRWEGQSWLKPEFIQMLKPVWWCGLKTEMETPYWSSQSRKESILNCLLIERQPFIYKMVGLKWTGSTMGTGWSTDQLYILHLWTKYVWARNQDSSLFKNHLYRNVNGNAHWH